MEQIFGWMKTVGLMRKTRHRGERRIGWMFVFTLAVHNLVRIRNLTALARVPMQEIQWAAFPTSAMVLRTAY